MNNMRVSGRGCTVIHFKGGLNVIKKCTEPFIVKCQMVPWPSALLKSEGVVQCCLKSIQGWQLVSSGAYLFKISRSPSIYILSFRGWPIFELEMTCK